MFVNQSGGYGAVKWGRVVFGSILIFFGTLGVVNLIIMRPNWSSKEGYVWDGPNIALYIITAAMTAGIPAGIGLLRGTRRSDG